MNKGSKTGTKLVAASPSIWLPILLTLITTAGSLSVILWFHYQAGDIEKDRHERAARMLASGITSSIEDDLVMRNYAQIETSLKLSLATESVKSALITDRNGHVLSHVKALGDKRVASPNFELQMLDPPSQTASYQEHGEAAVMWSPIGSKRTVGFLRLEFKQPQSDYAISALRTKVLVSTVAGSIISIFLLTVVIKRLRDLFKERELDLMDEQEILFNAACYDNLTLLPNRRLFMERLDQAIANSDRNGNMFAIIFCDLDGFKNINDNFGHEAGDQLLIVVAQRIQKVLRQVDTVSRFGGDEFVILLTDIQSRKDCVDVIDRLVAISNRSIDISGNSVICALSAGISLCPNDAKTTHDLLEHADKAMYRAKQEGKGRFYFYEDIRSDEGARDTACIAAAGIK